MKDIFLASNNGRFSDIMFEWVPVTVNTSTVNPKTIVTKRFRLVANEYKLAQSLKKLYLSREWNHPLGYGSNHSAFDAEEILKELVFYNTINQSTTPNEQISEIISIKEVSPGAYEVIVQTQAHTTLRVTVGE